MQVKQSELPLQMKPCTHFCACNHLNPCSVHAYSRTCSA